MGGAVEREVKLGAWAGLTLPDLTGVVEGGSVLALAPLRLTATYHDTSDLRLARWGITVRHRALDRPGANGSEGGWTVKLPQRSDGPGLVRTEHRFEGSEHRVPAGVLHLLRAYVRSASLVPVARLRTERLRLEVRGREGERLVEIDDDEVSVLVPGANGRGRRVAARFREIEVEAMDGAPTSLLDDIVARLREAGAGPPDPTPKVVRALGPQAVLPPEVAVPDLRDAPAGAVARAAIAAGVTRLLAHDPGVRLGEDPEDVHQARVATRRLRSDLRTFRPLLDEKWTAEIRDELGWLADLLGAVRDTDVLLERLEADTAELAAGDAGPAASLLRRLRSERDEARAALLEALDSDRYTALVDLLVEAAGALPAAAPVEDGGGGGEREGVVQPSEQPAAKVVPGLVQRPWRHLRRAVDELSEDPPDESLHRVRILAKRCRYAAEAAAPVVGKPARRLAEAVAGLQGVLGDLNDAVIAEAWLRAAVTRGPAAQALVAGELVARQRQRAAACRTAWPAAWKRASAKRLRSWLDGD